MQKSLSVLKIHATLHADESELHTTKTCAQTVHTPMQALQTLIYTPHLYMCTLDALHTTPNRCTMDRYVHVPNTYTPSADILRHATHAPTCIHTTLFLRGSFRPSLQGPKPFLVSPCPQNIPSVLPSPYHSFLSTACFYSVRESRF